MSTGQGLTRPEGVGCFCPKFWWTNWGPEFTKSSRLSFVAQLFPSFAFPDWVVHALRLRNRSMIHLIHPIRFITVGGVITQRNGCSSSVLCAVENQKFLGAKRQNQVSMA